MDIDIFKDFYDYACNECAGGHDACEGEPDECWADIMYKQLQDIHNENEQLKKEVKLYKCIDKWGTDECHCACRCLGNEFCTDADQKINKYKQTLNKVKEIAEKRNYLNLDEALDDILNVISEVENETK